MSTGESFSHYRIIAPLGAGGMGQVYLAQDTALGRKVALKLLPADFTRDKDRVRRFQQEARAASALNHPNIITILEIGQVEDRHFIATEFIDGETLRQHVRGPQTQTTSDSSRTSARLLKLRDILNIAIQTADALASAHEAGVVHRDIKPENIMVRRRDGYVKVLDFGLAKLTEGRSTIVDTEAPTMAHVQTSAGMVMGTASYMSPEQARGGKVDARTDIWSLGVVLYEMVAGCAPFERSTASEVIALILERQPPPLARYAREVPTELERIVSKALTKDREERYQTAKDLLIDLRRLRQRLEVEAEMERFATPGSASEATVTTDGGQAYVDGRIARTEESTARPTSSAEFLVSEINRHKRGALVALAIILLAFVGIGFGLYRLLRHEQGQSAPFQAINITRLTNNGKVTGAAISPDGKYVAYAMGEEAGRQSVHIKQVETLSDVEVVPPEGSCCWSLTFSPDSNYVVYVKAAKQDLGELYEVPTLGGASRKLLADVDGHISFSPDGKRLAFVRFSPSEHALMVANADGTGIQKLAARQGPDYFSPSGPAWSPDGKIIACPLRSLTGSAHYEIIGVDVERAAEITISSQKWRNMDQLAWLADGSGLVMTANENDFFGRDDQVWQVSYPSGEARRLTTDLNGYGGLSLSADSKIMAVVQTDLRKNLWLIPGTDATRARQILRGPENIRLGGGFSWTPDGKILYSSKANGNWDIWIMDANGSNQRQLTVDAHDDLVPVATPDHEHIVFVSTRAGAAQLWRMDIDGSNQQQLTNGCGDHFPEVTPDGKWVVYEKCVSYDVAMIYKVSLEGGTPIPLTGTPSTRPAVSPDGKLVACIYGDKPQFALLPIEGGPPVKLFDIPPTQVGNRGIQWTPDGRALAYRDTRDGVSNIWRLPIDGGPATQLTDFKSEIIFHFAWSHDGKQLALARGSVSSDVVLIRDLRDRQ